jgi:hypothetical protein
MYTQRHAVLLVNDSGFGLDRYAFTALLLQLYRSVFLPTAWPLKGRGPAVTVLQVGFNPRR